MQRKKIPPERPRYEFARRRAYQLLCQLEISSLPIDPWQITKQFPNINVCAWTDLRENRHVADPLNIDAEGADTKTHIVRGDDEYLVVYDDRVGSEQRIRWTLAHELAHIMLRHLVDFEATALNRGGLTEQQYFTLEREADCFAANLLAPMTILQRIPSLQSKWGIMEACDLSGKAARNCMEELKRLNSGRKILYPMKEEDVLHRLFFRYIRNVNNELPIVLRYDDVVISEEYDDYIECDYWEFAVVMLGKRKSTQELANALVGSLAIYDDEDMVIFLPDADAIPSMRVATDAIVEVLMRYADSSVRHIVVKRAILQQ